MKMAKEYEIPKLKVNSVIRHKKSGKCYVITGTSKFLSNDADVATLLCLNEKLEPGALYTNYVEEYGVLNKDYDFLFMGDTLIGMIGFPMVERYCDGLQDNSLFGEGAQDPNWDHK